MSKAFHLLELNLFLFKRFVFSRVDQIKIGYQSSFRTSMTSPFPSYVKTTKPYQMFCPVSFLPDSGVPKAIWLVE